MKERRGKIKAVIFDVGNVVLFYDHRIAARKMFKMIDIDVGKILYILEGKNKRFVDMFDLGSSSKKYWNLAAKIWKIKKISYKKFDGVWNTMFWLNNAIFPILKKLKVRYVVAGISNISFSHKRYILKEYKIKKFLKPLIFSCDVKMRKPEPRIYKFALKKLKVKPSETIFIDDKIENIVAANKVGIQGILFKNNKKLIKDLRKFGVSI